METATAVSGVPRLVLRAEGAAVLVAATLLYWQTSSSWWLYAVLFLAPDLSFLGYLAGPRVGAIVYNAAHTLVAPALLVAAAFLLTDFALIPLALIWTAHIGFDRLLGYGLKYGKGFGFTHLGHIGKAGADKP